MYLSMVCSLFIWEQKLGTWKWLNQSEVYTLSTQNWKQKFRQARVLLRLFRSINVLVAWTYNEKLVPKIAIKKLDIKKGD